MQTFRHSSKVVGSAVQGDGDHEKWSTFIPCGRVNHVRWATGHPTSDKSKNLTS
ncbi:hypothetical protein GBA52_010479 [Prunus armeniaca]|nr:hypothetical protein GBA52_010479 [Prunus armeniaca]